MIQVSKKKLKIPKCSRSISLSFPATSSCFHCFLIHVFRLVESNWLILIQNFKFYEIYTNLIFKETNKLYEVNDRLLRKDLIEIFLSRFIVTNICVIGGVKMQSKFSLSANPGTPELHFAHTSRRKVSEDSSARGGPHRSTRELIIWGVGVISFNFRC